MMSCIVGELWKVKGNRSGDTEQHLTGSQHRGQLNKHLQRVNATQTSVCSVEKAHILDSSAQLKMQSATTAGRKDTTVDSAWARAPKKPQRYLKQCCGNGSW